ncbi:MAG: ATP synthase F1 subunit delta [Edaphocola sp.]
MQNPRLAARYAKSLLDIALEQNNLEAIKADMEYIAKICAESRDFELMLVSPIIKGSKKEAIIKAVLGNNIQPTTRSFINLLINKGREVFLPEIAGAFAGQYRSYKKIVPVKLVTAAAIGDSLKKMIADKVAASVNDDKIELDTSIDASLIGGFTLEVGDKFFDASIKRNLNDIKKQFNKNLYTPSF